MECGEVKFGQSGLVPVIVQDCVTGEVLMLAYADQEAMTLTRQTGRAHFFSRSRGRLWQKGETSGNFLDVVDMRLDCDGDTVLLKVRPTGPVCHTGKRSCFAGDDDDGTVTILNEVWQAVCERRDHPVPDSYTCYLLDGGKNRVSKKLVEEALELVLAVSGESEQRVAAEAADLCYVLMVALAWRGVDPDNVYKQLARRRRGSGGGNEGGRTN